MASQDIIIDLKKGYLKHAACDGTQFELGVHYMPLYVATRQGLISGGLYMLIKEIVFY